MDIQLVNKYLQGDATESEVAELFMWMDAAPENKNELIAYKKVWALTSISIENEDQTWKELFAPKFRRQLLVKRYMQVARYAAIFLLLLGSVIILQYYGLGTRKEVLVYQKNTSIAAPLGQMTNVELPDGTRVMLNSGSSITCSGNYSSGDRTVSLSGEAYFDVIKDKEHPFKIETPLLDFVVYGTSFNIEAYPEDKMINTTLIEGSLGINDKSARELVRLVPGKNARFDASTSKLSVTDVNTEIYTSWKDGLITFRNEKLKDIARKIERWYNVRIVINNKELGEQAYYGTILKNKPVDQILEVLKLSSSFQYKMISEPDKPMTIYWY